MKTWKPGAGALICTCIFVLGEAGELVKHTHSCWIHAAVCVEQPQAPLHATDSNTFTAASTST